MVDRAIGRHPTTWMPHRPPTIGTPCHEQALALGPLYRPPPRGGRLIAKLNVYIRGAGEYFRLAEPRTLWNLDRFVLARIARWARHKRVRRLPEWSLARGTTLYREHGLVTWWRRKQPT
jgi:hypothetical protein